MAFRHKDCLLMDLVGSAQEPATRTCGIAPSFCTKSRYRSLDGTCNHLENPGLGIPQTPYKRVSQFARSVKGGPLPNVREISLVAFPDKPLVDPKWNLNAQQWGQIITHDMSLTAGVAQSHKDPLVCCDDSGQLAADAYSNPQCAPIIIPPTDRVNAPRGTQCMNFVRTASTRDRGCTPQDTPAQPNRLIYPGAQGYITDYNPEVDPSVLDEHATAAFRHFHTLIRGFLDLITEDRTVAGFARMSDWFNRPLLIEVDNIFDKLTRGLTTQAQGFSDQFWDSEITQFLFRRNNTFGGDLRATDIQRGRDHGLGSYVATRAACGLPVPKTFYEMTDFIAKENVDLLATLYEHVEDVDLVVGGSLEVNVIGAQAGPTFLCILTEQFYRTRVGDRYFYETGDPDIAFTPSQLQSIRHGASMARILCDNADNIRYMQPRAFELISTGNRPVLCEQLPAIDLNLWQDHGGAYV
ncbi:unnamed protein product [Leptidea sinapis]|uniref:Peroxidase n=1 Tax=Leptidea sinapis TaxID=189913 RepID=A0A5E4Q6G9_9NEOP|nr:unnamed protein product [Leptidea sinapis]